MLARLDAKIRQFGIGNIDVHAMPEGQLTFRRALSTETAAFGYHLRDSASWWQVTMFGPVRAMLENLPAGRMKGLHALRLADVERDMTAAGLWLNVPVNIARGLKPSG